MYTPPLTTPIYPPTSLNLFCPSLTGFPSLLIYSSKALLFTPIRHSPRNSIHLLHTLNVTDSGDDAFNTRQVPSPVYMRPAQRLTKMCYQSSSAADDRPRRFQLATAIGIGISGPFLARFLKVVKELFEPSTSGTSQTTSRHCLSW